MYSHLGDTTLYTFIYIAAIVHAQDCKTICLQTENDPVVTDTQTVQLWFLFAMQRLYVAQWKLLNSVVKTQGGRLTL